MNAASINASVQKFSKFKTQGTKHAKYTTVNNANSAIATTLSAISARRLMDTLNSDSSRQAANSRSATRNSHATSAGSSGIGLSMAGCKPAIACGRRSATSVVPGTAQMLSRAKISPAVSVGHMGLDTIVAPPKQAPAIAARPSTGGG